MNIAIITGGSGPEREISILSADFLEKNINFASHKTFLYPDEFETFLQEKDSFDVVIPVIHGEDGEDGVLQRELDRHNINYIFSSPGVHRQCFNKSIAKEFVRNINFKIPREFSLHKIRDDSFPLIVKPKEGGSSVGIYIVKNREELHNLGVLDNYLYEEYIKGREFTIGVIDTPNGLHVLPIMEVKTKKEIFDFEDKYSSSAENIEVFPNDLSQELENRLKEFALTIHTKFKLRHVSRIDCIVSASNDIYFIEINSIPGSTAISFIPKMIKKDKLVFSEILKHWCDDVIKTNSQE